MSALWLAPLGARLSIPHSAAGPPAVLELTGRPVTGFNRRFGKPAFLLGAPLGTHGFTTLGAWNPAGATPQPLTPELPAETVLATAVDPHLLAVFGLPAVDPGLINRPLADVPAVVALDGRRAPLPDHLASTQQTPSRAAGSPRPITLGAWLQAGGQGRLRPRGPRGAALELEISGLVPHGLYSVWGLLNTFRGTNPVPLGGLPNAFVAGPEGTAVFRRELNFDPLEPAPGEAPLALIDVVFHADHALVGGLRERLFAGFPPGAVTTAHVEFVVDGIPV